MPEVVTTNSIASGEYLILCQKVDFEFGIGSDDTITLLDEDGAVVSEVMLPGMGGDEETYSYFDTDGMLYKYTKMATPGLSNVYIEPKTLEQRLNEQYDAGIDFFDGTSSLFDKVVDLHITMEDESLAMIQDHPTYEEFVPFLNVAVHNPNNDTAIHTTTGGGGKIRTKGQYSLIITACLKLSNVPFQIEFDTPFYGMEVAYLRNHMGDGSYMRDYASHVLLKEFGLPYLRCRHVRLFLNGEYVGFYTLMEAPTHAYVMQVSNNKMIHRGKEEECCVHCICIIIFFYMMMYS